MNQVVRLCSSVLSIYNSNLNLFIYIKDFIPIMDSLPDNRTSTPGIIKIYIELYISIIFRNELN